VTSTACHLTLLHSHLTADASSKMQEEEDHTSITQPIELNIHSKLQIMVPYIKSNATPVALVGIQVTQAASASPDFLPAALLNYWSQPSPLETVSIVTHNVVFNQLRHTFYWLIKKRRCKASSPHTPAGCVCTCPPK
jgi:hypothetical protein